MIKSSELIINKDGSIYHLQLKPGEVAQTIITVGDPARVDSIVQHFDTILVNKQNREFKTVTGLMDNKRITVIATGIGTDNIDIVINELDALFNVDFKTREVKEKKVSLDLIRIGTSGAINANVPINSFLISEWAIGLDGLLSYYNSEHVRDGILEKQFQDTTGINNAYAVKGDEELAAAFSQLGQKGITVTANGFYGPQSRSIRLNTQFDILKCAKNFNYKGVEITNLEMETAGIYGLSQLLGHKAISLNAILASRYDGSFSISPQRTVEKLISETMTIIKNWSRKTN